MYIYIIYDVQNRHKSETVLCVFVYLVRTFVVDGACHVLQYTCIYTWSSNTYIHTYIHTYVHMYIYVSTIQGMAWLPTSDSYVCVFIVDVRTHMNLVQISHSRRPPYLTYSYAYRNVYMYIYIHTYICTHTYIHVYCGHTYTRINWNLVQSSPQRKPPDLNYPYIWMCSPQSYARNKHGDRHRTEMPTIIPQLLTLALPKITQALRGQ